MSRKTGPGPGGGTGPVDSHERPVSRSATRPRGGTRHGAGAVAAARVGAEARAGARVGDTARVGEAPRLRWVMLAVGGRAFAAGAAGRLGPASPGPRSTGE